MGALPGLSRGMARLLRELEVRRRRGFMATASLVILSIYACNIESEKL